MIFCFVGCLGRRKVFAFWLGLFIYYLFIYLFGIVVTAVESGTRALQYLGLDGEKSSVGLDVSKPFGLFLCWLLCLIALFGLLRKWRTKKKENAEVPFGFMCFFPNFKDTILIQLLWILFLLKLFSEYFHFDAFSHQPNRNILISFLFLFFLWWRISVGFFWRLSCFWVVVITGFESKSDNDGLLNARDDWVWIT